MKYVSKISLKQHKYKTYNKNFNFCDISATISVFQTALVN